MQVEAAFSHYGGEHTHEMAKGRMALPMPGQHVNVVTIGEPSSRPLSAVTMTSSSHTADEEEEGDFVIDYSESYQGQTFPDANIDPNSSQWAIQEQIDSSHAISQENHRRGVPPGARPPLLHSQSLQIAPQRPQPVRYGSFPGPARSASPHLIAGDVFAAPGLTGSPVRRSQSAFGMQPPPPTMNGANGGAHMRQTHEAGFTQSQAHDLFYNPGRHASINNLPQQPVAGHQSQLGHIGQQAQGISPMRALGPPPQQSMRFSPDRPDGDLMITPDQKTGYHTAVHSSATSSTATSASSVQSSGFSSASSYDPNPNRRKRVELSEDETDSPTRPPAALTAKRLDLRPNAVAGPSTHRSHIAPHPQANASLRPQRPMAKPPMPPPASIRAAPKPMQCAEDPGVEGVPPGERSMERPGPSFACIIGQAILKSAAGGLSLEHIYRYVETAYPFFKSGDGAWRNSVRHNLSIHKMFKTIARTERHPAGKGGIWVIEETEKCHWPAEDKFIKNFPPTHAHHATCLQTLHEQRKEADAIAKAKADGVEYVPKKGKKGRKLGHGGSSSAIKDEDGGMEMMRSSSAMSETHHLQLQRPLPTYPPMGQPHFYHIPPGPRAMHPPPHAHYMEHPANAYHMMPQDMDDEGEFLPELEHQVFVERSMPPPPLVMSRDDALARNGMLNPSRLEKTLSSSSISSHSVGEKRPAPIEDDFFGSGASASKKVRMAVSDPREPVVVQMPIPQEPVPSDEVDDEFVTPEREKHATKAHFPSSAFKTPALVNTSSSPGSSPMPPTITRNPHLPSSLSSGWSADDIVTIANGGDAKPMLESAFDLKPTPFAAATAADKKKRLGMMMEDDYPSAHAHTVFPKTPVSRSSAGVHVGAGAGAGGSGITPGRALKSPRQFATPMYVRSPAREPGSISAMMSTPLWEIGGCLQRLGDGGGSPTTIKSVGVGARSPGLIVPPTSPTRYSLSLPDASPKKTAAV